MTLTDLWSVYEADKRILGFSPHTLKAYALQVKVLVREVGDLEIEEIFDLCIASGRMNSEIQILLQPFANRYYAVGQNGATIHLHDQRLLASAEFTPELSTQLLQVTGRDRYDADGDRHLFIRDNRSSREDDESTGGCFWHRCLIHADRHGHTYCQV